MPHLLSSTIFKVLDILNDGEVHNGSDIATALGISRAAVWKVIQRLKKYNIDIESQHQGYRLSFPLILFDQQKIGKLLKSPDITLEIFETIPSTSEYLRTKAPIKNRNICLAESQSEGRGRLGRAWLSPFGRNIFCSFSFIFNKDISEMSGLSLVIGLLTVKALESLAPTLKFNLKWPNDIYLDNQKMGGILINLMAEAHGSCAAIISMGLNINMKDVELGGIEQPWTSLEHALHEKLDRNHVAARLIQSILEGMVVFQEKGMGPFLPEWKRYDWLENRQVSLTTGTETISGLAKGINPQGCLLLELPSGIWEKFSCGDTMLLKN